ncbi:MAG TPA: hypothetical protein VGN57_20255 [Pirellulaceae bacterium]|jgi:hypothetical protein|nr:hypothetical protein [Pirellulaceae bacterium]
MSYQKLVPFLLATASLVIALSPAFAQESPTETDVDLKKLGVDALVDRLASPFPALRLSGGGFDPMADQAFHAHPHFSQKTYTVIHPNVAAATEELKLRGTDAIPSLLKHSGDRRYSWTGSFAAIRDMTVGEQVDDVIEDILYPEIRIDWTGHIGGFKEQPSFGRYLTTVGGVERYLDWSKSASARERELHYLCWHVKAVDELRERFRRHRAEEGEWLDEYLAPYRKRIAELEAAGVATRGPLDEKPPEPSADAEPATPDR